MLIRAGKLHPVTTANVLTCEGTKEMTGATTTTAAAAAAAVAATYFMDNGALKR